MYQSMCGGGGGDGERRKIEYSELIVLDCSRSTVTCI